ncbi:hypothetical protein QE454_001461 [Microbacterium sp. SORGH_AS454]|nr:hypothetical protein [Microbacterium sp. SORGH_AS_0454]
MSASRSGTDSASARDPAVVGRPATSMLSFTRTVTPSSPGVGAAAARVFHCSSTVATAPKPVGAVSRERMRASTGSSTPGWPRVGREITTVLCEFGN